MLKLLKNNESEREGPQITGHGSIFGLWRFDYFSYAKNNKNNKLLKQWTKLSLMHIPSRVPRGSCLSSVTLDNSFGLQIFHDCSVSQILCQALGKRGSPQPAPGWVVRNLLCQLTGFGTPRKYTSGGFWGLSRDIQLRRQSPPYILNVGWSTWKGRGARGAPALISLSLTRDTRHLHPSCCYYHLQDGKFLQSCRQNKALFPRDAVCRVFGHINEKRN